MAGERENRILESPLYEFVRMRWIEWEQRILSMQVDDSEFLLYLVWALDSIKGNRRLAIKLVMMGCCKLAGVNVETWLTYFLDHVHEYDNDYSLDIADFLPSSLASKGLVKTS